ncbi:SAM-dependent methyltransferase [Actinomadura miaoliensis]|uniref:SAM-dependent methyltransferase n=1 Tax=Actinomadura miaoliensis TaxID=430685 RepID=A0ABP7WKE1_9ACTN
MSEPETATAAPPAPASARSRPWATAGEANPARFYDLLLGGKDNYAADRDLADPLLRVQPHARTAARENRAFVGRAVRALAEHGVAQFVDIGCGLPTGENVHQIAQRHVPGARVVYVDHDPIVLSHARALLADDGNVSVVRADLRDHDGLLEAVTVAAPLDWTRPVGVLLTSVLHHLAAADRPHELAAGLRRAMPPGSALAVSHLTADPAPAAVAEAASLYTAGCGTPLVPRGRAEVAAFLDGLELLGPGVVFTSEWRPVGPVRPPDQALMYAAVGLRG